MAPTPLEQDHIKPSRIQRVVMAAMRKPRVGFGLSDRGPSSADPTSPELPAIALAQVTLRLEDGVLIALGPEGDPVPPAAFRAAAARQPEVEVALSDGGTARAIRVAAVLDAQARGPLGLRSGGQKNGEAWIRAMLGLGPQPGMASDEELRGEGRACELTAFGRELMVTMPSGRSFLIAEAAPAHQAEASVSLTLADGRAVSVGDLVARLRAHDAPRQGATGRAGGDSAAAEMVLPGCVVQRAGEALLLQLPPIGVVRLASLDPAAPPGPKVSVFLPDGAAAGMAAVLAELDRVTIRSEPAAAQFSGKGRSSPPEVAAAAPAPADDAPDRDRMPAAAMAAPVPLTFGLPDGVDASGIAMVVIGGVPQHAVLSAGVADGEGSWVLSPKDLVGLTLTVPAGRTGEVVLRVTAVTISNREGELATAAHSVRVALDPTPPRPLAIDPAVLQQGGPGLNALVIRGLPDGVRLSAGTHDPAIDGWVLLPRQLAGLTLTAPAGQAGFTLTVLGIALGAGGGGHAKVLTRLPVAAR